MSDVIFNQVLEVSTPKRVDSPYSSEPVYDYESTSWVPLSFPVSVQPASDSTEDTVQRPVVITRLVLITPPGTDIPDLAAESRVRVGGIMVCDVIGAPARWPDPYAPGKVHHLEAILEIVDG